MEAITFRKAMVIGLTILFLGACLAPSVSGSEILYPTDDTYVNMRSPDQNYGPSGAMELANRYGHPSHPKNWERDLLFRFDLSSISPETPVCSAILHIYYYDFDDTNPKGRELTLYRVTSDWDEEIVTWNTRPTCTSEVTSGSIVPSSTGHWMEWDVTNDVQDFVNGEETNYGWQIMDTTTWGAYNIPVPRFRSREYGDYIPYLEINDVWIYGYVTCFDGTPIPNIMVWVKYGCHGDFPWSPHQTDLTSTDSSGYYEFCEDEFGGCGPDSVDFGWVFADPPTGFRHQKPFTSVPESVSFKFYCGPPPPSCPYVSAWNGKELVRDNNILPQSEQPDTDEDVTDYYLLCVPLQPQAGEYYVRIEEFENEHTYADRFELGIIDHSPKLNVGVTENGEILTYGDLLIPKEITSSLDADHYELITKADGRSARIQANEVVTLNFGPVDSPYGARLVVDMKPDHVDIAGQTSFRKGSIISYAVVTSQTESMYMKGVSREGILLRPRENGTVAIGDFTSLLPPDGQDFIIQLDFPASHSVDFIGLDLSEQVPLEVKRISLASATHSKDGDVTQELSLTDGVYAELVPGEQIELFFKAPQERGEDKRDFILISRGHYFKDASSSVLPEKFSLSQNYPNPFNPVTEIRYNLSNDCYVRLEVYNTLGQRVATLVDAQQKAGYRKATWDATGLASGIYFYRISAGDFTSTRKMVLLK